MPPLESICQAVTIGIVIILSGYLVWDLLTSRGTSQEIYLSAGGPSVPDPDEPADDPADHAEINNLLHEVIAQASPPLVPQVSPERQAQFDLQAQMAQAVAGPPGDGFLAATTLYDRVDRGYDYRDDLVDKRYLIEPDDGQPQRTPPLAAVGVSPRDIPEHIRNCPMHDPDFWVTAAPRQHTTFGGKLNHCGDLKLKVVYDWFCNNLSEGERQDLYRAGGMKACDEACVQMARHVLGYDRSWWQRLLGLGMPRKRDLPPALQRLV